MSTAPQVEARTRTFARIIGPYLVVVTATAVAHARVLRALLTTFQANPMWPWLTGAFVLPMGLIVVTLHRHWRGAAAALVSGVGWLTALKGLLLMVIPETYVSAADSALGASGWWRAPLVVVGLVGLYLTYVGWVAAPGRLRPEAGSTGHLRPAA
ncbi:MAG: hypothetical protein ACLQIK_27170 [Mycobacterium sp.]|uniref:hypothetical protein n=1 Tax=Mycobacterium sp. TaxID=1785 RepID=UPI003F961449